MKKPLSFEKKHMSIASSTALCFELMKQYFNDSQKVNLKKRYNRANYVLDGNLSVFGFFQKKLVIKAGDDDTSVQKRRCCQLILDLCIFDTCLTQLYNYTPATKKFQPGYVPPTFSDGSSVSLIRKGKTVINKLENTEKIF